MAAKKELLQRVIKLENKFRAIQQQEDAAREYVTQKINEESDALPKHLVRSFRNFLKLSGERRDAWQEAAELWGEITKLE